MLMAKVQLSASLPAQAGIKGKANQQALVLLDCLSIWFTNRDGHK